MSAVQPINNWSESFGGKLSDLSLTVSNTMDVFCNDFIFSLGQKRPVIVYRLVTAKTIDEKIVERAAAKRKLEKMVIHSKK